MHGSCERSISLQLAYLSNNLKGEAHVSEIHNHNHQANVFELDATFKISAQFPYQHHREYTSNGTADL